MSSSVDIMQDGEYLKKFGDGPATSGLDGGVFLDLLSQWFARYEAPIGLINKLLALSEYKLNFIIDDSVSMGSDTDVAMSSATTFLKTRHSNNKRVCCSQKNQALMTRWEEAEDRLHILLDVVALIPTGEVCISCLNGKTVLKLAHHGQGPEAFARDAHEQVSKLFDVGAFQRHANLQRTGERLPRQRRCENTALLIHRRTSERSSSGCRCTTGDLAQEPAEQSTHFHHL